MPSQPEREEQRLQRRQPDVEEPEPPRRRADPLAELLDLRPGQLRLDQLPSADAEARQHREREDDDPHAAEPLRELPPHRERAVEVVEVRDDARTGRREARHALEVGVDGWSSWSPPARRYGIAANAAARSQRQRRRRGSPRGSRRCRAAPAVSRSSPKPTPLRARRPTRNGQTGSPYQSASRVGKSAARPRYFASVPTRFDDGADARSRAAAGGPIRAAPCVNSERLDDPGCVRRLGEDDHAVARLEDVVAVREDRRRRCGRSRRSARRGSACRGTPCRCTRSTRRVVTSSTS